MESRFTEFLSVLGAALAIGVAVILILQYLQGNWRFVAFIVLIGVAVLISRMLRKRFGRE